MYGNANSPGLVRDSPCNGLPDPPGRISRELIAAAVLELIYGLHQADVTLLNQIEKLQAAIGVLLGDGDHQAQIGFNQLALSLLGVHVALNHLALRALQLPDQHARVVLNLLQIRPAVFLLTPVLFLQLLAFRDFKLLVQRADLPLQRAHGVHGLVDLVQQPLALNRCVLQFAHDSRDEDLFARDQPAEAPRVADPSLGRRLNCGLLLLKLRNPLLVLH